MKDNNSSPMVVALQKVRIFEQTQNQIAREATLNLIGQRLQTGPVAASVLRIATQELGQALGVRQTNVQLHNPNNPINTTTFNDGRVPLSEKLS